MSKKLKLSPTKRTQLFGYIHKLERTQRVKMIVIYLISIGSSGIALAVSLFTSPLTGGIFYVPSVLAVTISAWHGTFEAGIVTLILSILGIYYFFLMHSNSMITIIQFLQLAIFVVASLTIIYIIHKTKKSDEIQFYKNREKTYAHLLIDLEQENKKARDEVIARDEFLSIVSHELKTPLTSMLLQIQTALHNISNVSLSNFSVQNLLIMLQNAEEQSKRLSKMINDLLNVSLITTGRLNLEKEEVNLGELTKKVIDRMSEKITREGYTISVKAQDNVVGQWDKLRIEQVIINLLTNALKYGNKMPIYVEVTRNDSKGILIVKDGGIGIANGDQEKIFGRFKRAVTSQEFKGLGVGLYVTNQIIHSHKGTIKVHSKIGNGSTFIVELPLKTT